MALYFVAADALLPGSLVSVRVKHLATDGLLVAFLSFFQGTIDAFHLREVCASLLSLLFVGVHLQ